MTYDIQITVSRSDGKTFISPLFEFKKEFVVNDGMLMLEEELRTVVEAAIKE